MSNIRFYYWQHDPHNKQPFENEKRKRVREIGCKKKKKKNELQTAIYSNKFMRHCPIVRRIDRHSQDLSHSLARLFAHSVSVSLHRFNRFPLIPLEYVIRELIFYDYFRAFYFLFIFISLFFFSVLVSLLVMTKHTSCTGTPLLIKLPLLLLDAMKHNNRTDGAKTHSFTLFNAHIRKRSNIFKIDAQ